MKKQIENPELRENLVIALREYLFRNYAGRYETLSVEKMKIADNKINALIELTKKPIHTLTMAASDRPLTKYDIKKHDKLLREIGRKVWIKELRKERKAVIKDKLADEYPDIDLSLHWANQ